MKRNKIIGGLDPGLVYVIRVKTNGTNEERVQTMSDIAKSFNDVNVKVVVISGDMKIVKPPKGMRVILERKEGK